ncbi:putative phage abortive infection protein [Achromobacter xylosoxidans]
MTPTFERQWRRAAKTRRLILLFLALPSSVAITAMGVFVYKFHGRSLSSETGDWGTFGDFLGGIVNPVAGLVTIVLLVLTLRSQQDELEEQRSQIARQAFEQTFFTWLSSYTDAVASLELGPEKFLTGVHALAKMIETENVVNGIIADWRLNEFSQDSPAVQDRRRIELRAEIRDWWRPTYGEHEPQLGRLIRTLFTLVRWIDRHPTLTDSERWDYVSIVRARLSSPELRFLFFNAFHPEGRAFTEYLERYALLDNLPLSSNPFIRLCTRMNSFPFELQALNSDLARKKRNAPTSPSE